MMKNFELSAGDIIISHFTDNMLTDSLDVSHCHDSYEILYIASGEGDFHIEGSSFPFNSGSILVINPLEYHSIELNDITEEKSYERYAIQFSDKHLSDEVISLLKSLLRGEGVSGKYYSSVTLSDAVLPVFERFEYASILPEEERKVYFKILISELIVLLSAFAGERMVHEQTELGARVIKYLNENFLRNISLDKLARKFFVSKYYLCRAFKKHNGISVHGYINKKRIMYAKSLIESGESASGAAYKVGFGDYSAFYRAYVKITGKAPTAEK